MVGERRWIILADDGRHSAIGRHTDPSDEEIARAGEQLRALGLGGWLAVSEGGYYQPSDKVSLMMVREIAPTAQPWETAVAAFMMIRSAAIAPPSPPVP